MAGAIAASYFALFRTSRCRAQRCCLSCFSFRLWPAGSGACDPGLFKARVGHQRNALHPDAQLCPPSAPSKYLRLGPWKKPHQRRLPKIGMF
jgi:hypothetical protein